MHSMGNRFFCSAKHPDQLSGPPSLLLNGCWEHLPRGGTTCHLVQRLRMSVTVPPLPHLPSWHAQELHLYHIIHMSIVVEGHLLSPSGQRLHFFSTINISNSPTLKPGHQHCHTRGCKITCSMMIKVKWVHSSRKCIDSLINLGPSELQNFKCHFIGRYLIDTTSNSCWSRRSCFFKRRIVLCVWCISALHKSNFS